MDETQHNEGAGQGTFSLERTLFAVRRRWRLVAALTAAALAVSVGVALMLPTRYDASSVVQIDPRKKSISNLQGVISDLGPDAATVESEVEIIRSRSITLKVIDLLDLRNDPEFSKPSRWSQLMALIGLGGDDDAKPANGAQQSNPTDPISALLGPDKPGQSRPERDEVAVAFAERLRVARIRTTLLIDIRFSASDAVKAARIANTIAEVYVREQLTSKQQAAGLATGMLEGKLEEMRRKVADAEQAVEQFKAEHNIFDSEGQILGEKQLARLMEQTVIARNTTAEAKAKYEQLARLRREGGNPAAIADVLQSHTVRLLKEQLAKATRAEAEMATRYGPRHPEMQKIRAEVADAQAQVDAEIERTIANLKNEYEVASDRERQMAQSLGQLKAQQVLSKEASVRLKELEREASSSKQLFEALLTRYKQTSETQSLQLPDARIVEQADAPLFPAAPKRKQIVALGTFGGLIAGLMLALALEFLTSGIARPEDIERTFELAHLSSLPSMTAVGEPPVDPLKAVRLVVAEPQSRFADAIRSVRREIDLRRADGVARSILVAASLPNEGASVIASNLAHHYALTGSRVLLIDADLRRRALSRQFSMGRRAGLADVLEGRAALDAVVLRDGRTGLNLMPASSGAQLVRSPPELLASPAMGQLLTALKASFDTIVVDAPPLLPVIDGRFLADHVDQILFVTTWRRTPKQLAKRALQSLAFNERKLLGAVVNQVDPDVLDEIEGVSAGAFALQPLAKQRVA